MTVYVDGVVFLKPRGRKAYAHMVADSIPELHAFAARLSVGSHFYHRHQVHPHYDINMHQHQKAIESGAVLVSSRELLEKAKAMTL